MVSRRRRQILGKLGALFTVLAGGGAGIDQGTMLRYLQEMTWFPSAFLNDNITFAPIDDGSAQVTFTDHGGASPARCSSTPRAG